MDESLPVEVAEWLERIGQHSEPFVIMAKRLTREHLTSFTQNIDFNRFFSERILDVEYRLPKSAIQRDTGLTEAGFQEVKGLIGTHPDSGGFRIEIVFQEVNGVPEDVVVIHQQIRVVGEEAKARVIKIQSLLKDLVLVAISPEERERLERWAREE